MDGKITKASTSKTNTPETRSAIKADSPQSPQSRFFHAAIAQDDMTISTEMTQTTISPSTMVSLSPRVTPETPLPRSAPRRTTPSHSPQVQGAIAGVVFPLLPCLRLDAQRMDFLL